MRKNNEAIIEYLKDLDPTFGIEDNVYYAKKAFIVKSILEWCTNGKEADRLTINEVKAYLSLIHQFVKGEINLFWLNDTVTYTKVIRRDKDAEEI
jgi:hypothetical protein